MATGLKSDLLNCLSGSNVIVDGDEGWPDAIKRWTGYQAKIPAAIVRVINEEDVISAVKIHFPVHYALTYMYSGLLCGPKPKALCGTGRGPQQWLFDSGQSRDCH